MKTVYLYVHTHWDREWYREFEEFRLRLVEVVDDVLSKLKSGELPCFYFDGQTAALEDYLEIHPEREKEIRNFIKQKKLFIGPFYCSADSFLVSAEFMLRNLKIGTEYSKNFGCSDFIGYLSDTFGHSASMPEILHSFGIEKAMLWRGLGNLPAEFMWKNICTTYLIQGYFQDFFSINADYDKKAEFLKNYLDKIAERSSDNILLPCGADHLKVADSLPEQIKEINKRLKGYKIKLSTPFEYLDTVKNNYKQKVDGEFLDQSKNFLLKGVYSSRIYQKRQNALCEWKLSRIAEPLATLGNLWKKSKNWQNEIDYAYKKTIKNHAHDSIYGCSIDAVHEDVERRFKRSKQVASGIKNRVIRDLTSDCDTLKFINLSNFNYSGLVEIETEKNLDKKYNAQLISKRNAFPANKLFDPAQIPVTEDMTTIKKYLVEVENLSPFSAQNAKINTKISHKITQNSIENDFVSLKVKNRKICVTDRISDKTYNNFIEITDRADVGDSYNFGALKGDKPIVAKLISSKIKAQGHLKSTLRLVFEADIPKISNLKKRSKRTLKHKFFVDVSLSNLSRALEFDINWENKSKNHILQVKFNLPNPVTKTFSEDMLGMIERDFDPDYDVYKRIPAPRGIELKTNTAPMQRFVWAQNVGVATVGLNEYEIFKNSLSLTLLRATGLISEPHNPTRGTPAGPPLECPKLQCLGKNHAEFCMSFTKTPEEMYKITESLYKPIVAYFGEENYKAPFEIDNKNILVQAVKLSKEKDLIIRLANISLTKQKFDFRGEFKSVMICDSLENEIKPLKNSITLAPKKLLTLKCH